jgi:hypothetical protein
VIETPPFDCHPDGFDCHPDGFDCHPEQVFVAQPGIWASRAMRRVFATQQSRVWLASSPNSITTPIKGGPPAPSVYVTETAAEPKGELGDAAQTFRLTDIRTECKLRPYQLS